MDRALLRADEFVSKCMRALHLLVERILRSLCDREGKAKVLEAPTGRAHSRRAVADVAGSVECHLDVKHRLIWNGGRPSGNHSRPRDRVGGSALPKADVCGGWPEFQQEAGLHGGAPLDSPLRPTALLRHPSRRPSVLSVVGDGYVSFSRETGAT
jgi:hypothetical protein